MWREKLTTTLLKSPFHEVIGHDTMLLTYTGKLSQQKFTIPIHYFTIRPQRHLAFIERNRQWWKNITNEVDVELNIHQETFSAKPLLIDHREAVGELLQNCLLSRPDLAHTYHVQLDHEGLVKAENIVKVSRELIAVYLKVYTILELPHHIP